MRLKTPSFWYPDSHGGKKCYVSEIALSPLALIYQFLHKLNQALQTPYKASMPIICIGNINAGGSGKTPIAIAVMDILKSAQTVKNPFFLSRGYGGLVTMATVVDPDIHDHVDVGDEAMVLQSHGPIITARKRKNGAKLATLQRCDALIMDDGLQNGSLQKTVTFCVIDGDAGFGNGKTLPAGPLRESLASGFKGSDAFVLIGDDKHNLAAMLPADKPLFKAILAVTDKPDTKTNYVAFAGIGRPEKFKATLEAQKMKVAEFIPFADHHSFSKSDLAALVKTAEKHNATLITTEKDMARLPPEFVVEHHVKTLPITIKWDDQKAVESFLKSAIKGYNKGA